jgi:hypothetical protein
LSPVQNLRIVCTETEFPHRHITAVGTGIDGNKASTRWTVAQVRAAIRSGNTRFHTYDPISQMTADVEPYDVYVGGHLIQTIRSTPDANPRNNLDNLRGCRPFT